MEITYHLIVVIVAVFALARGWKLGFTSQMGGILGFAFGAVVAHVVMEPFEQFFFELHIWPVDSVVAEFGAKLMAVTTAYTGTYILLWFVGRLIAAAMSLFSHGVLDRLFGSVVCLVKYLLALSLFFNFAVACNPSSALMKYATDDDGNLVEGVMLIAPATLGNMSFEELAHAIQLREARKISLNILSIQNVNYTAVQA